MIHALISGTVAFLLALALGLPILRYLQTHRAGKQTSEYQPQSHQSKTGTPTFGGFIIWVPTLLVTAVAINWTEHRSIMLPLAVIGITGIAGFVDDMGSLQHRAGGGLSWRFKLGFLTLLGLGCAWILYDQLHVQSINIPWAGKYELGPAYILIATLTIVSMTTAVAISDGLDGLAGGTTLLAFIAYGIIGFMQGQQFVATFAFIIAGANLGFLWFNAHPAMVIMGDTGALALGASLSVVALMTGHWLLLPVVGVVFVAEAVSDVIQVGYFKISHGKRVFRRAPLHNHLEEGGWAETQVVTRFWLIGIASAMLGVALALAVPA